MRALHSLQLVSRAESQSIGLLLWDAERLLLMLPGLHRREDLMLRNDVLIVLLQRLLMSGRRERALRRNRALRRQQLSHVLQHSRRRARLLIRHLSLRCRDPERIHDCPLRALNRQWIHFVQLIRLLLTQHGLRIRLLRRIKRCLLLCLIQCNLLQIPVLLSQKHLLCQRRLLLLLLYGLCCLLLQLKHLLFR